MTERPQRGRLTDYLVRLLEAAAGDSGGKYLAGDGKIPDAAGWPEGSVGRGVYVASAVLHTGPATARNEELRSNTTGWRMIYRLVSTGAVRNQADDVADLVRPVFDQIAGQVLDIGGNGWKVTRVHIPQLAPVGIQKGSDPPIFEVDDTVEIWLDYQRTAT